MSHRANENSGRQPGADTAPLFTPKNTALRKLMQWVRWLLHLRVRPAHQACDRIMRRHLSLIADSSIAADDAIVRNDRDALIKALNALDENVAVIRRMAVLV